MATRRIARTAHLKRLQALMTQFPVVALVGARQVGKSTLARDLVRSRRGPFTWFDLENPLHFARLTEPFRTLERLRGLVVIDEVQHLPGLFEVLRVLADRDGPPARFLVLGSASRDLLRQGSESLAGRISYIELPGLSLPEVGASRLERLWLRGGFPRAYLEQPLKRSVEWRRAFISTFLERDLRDFAIDVPPPTMRRFWTMLAHYHGQIWNGSELARSFGMSDHTVRKYLDALTATFMVRQLLPWHENLGKRQVKSPKVYLGDSGLLHTLLGLGTLDEILGHPKIGASWEGFALGEVIQRLRAHPEQCFFWATQSGAELDLLVVSGPRRAGFEFKYTGEPKVTPSMRSALADLRLDRLTVIHAGEHSFPLGDRIEAVALVRLLDDVHPLG
jgi:hypothetical protein